MGRPGGSRRSSGCGPCRHLVHPAKARGVSQVRPRFPRLGPHEGRPGGGRAVGDGGQHPPLGQRQAVPRRRILPAEPVECLAQEPQLGQPRGGDGAQGLGGGRAEGRPRAGGQFERRRGQPRARVRVRQLAQLPGGQLPEAAEAGDASVFAYADQGDAFGGNAQIGQAGEDFGDLQLVIQVRLEPQHVLPVAAGLQGLVPLGELAHRLGALDAVVAGQVVGPDPAQLGRRDLGHRPLVQDVAPVDHAPREPGPRHVGGVAVADVERRGHPVQWGVVRRRARVLGEEPAAGDRVRLAGLGHPGAHAPLESGLLGHDRLPRPVRGSPAMVPPTRPPLLCRWLRWPAVRLRSGWPPHSRHPAQRQRHLTSGAGPPHPPSSVRLCWPAPGLRCSGGR